MNGDRVVRLVQLPYGVRVYLVRFLASGGKQDVALPCDSKHNAMTAPGDRETPGRTRSKSAPRPPLNDASRSQTVRFGPEVNKVN